MAPKYRLFATVAASAFALTLSAGAVFAQKGLLPPPVPDAQPVHLSCRTCRTRTSTSIAGRGARRYNTKTAPPGNNNKG